MEAVALEKPTKTVKEAKPETVIFKLVDQSKSGFIREGTENLPEPDELVVSRFRKIVSHSYYMENNRIVPIRYIRGCDEIHVSEQERLGVKPNPQADAIIIRNGVLAAENSGFNIGLIKYLRNSTFCGTNPKRDTNTPVIWVEVFPEKNKEQNVDEAFEMQEAIALIKRYVRKTKDGYEYNEPQLSALCNLFGTYADTPAGMAETLVGLAKMNPKDFISKVHQFDNESVAEIAIAVDLGVLKFTNTTCEYVNKNKIIKTFSPKLTLEQKFSDVAAYFSSLEGQGEYKIFKAEVASAKEKKSNK